MLHGRETHSKLKSLKEICMNNLCHSLQLKRNDLIEEWEKYLKAMKTPNIVKQFNASDFKALPGNKKFNPLRPLTSANALKNRYMSVKKVSRTPFRSSQDVPPPLTKRDKKFPILDHEAIKANIEHKKAKKPSSIQGIIFLSICLFF
jgi:hypothetical protein